MANSWPGFNGDYDKQIGSFEDTPDAPVLLFKILFVAAARKLGPAIAFSPRRGGDECQLPTLQLIFEFTLNG